MIRGDYLDYSKEDLNDVTDWTVDDLLSDTFDEMDLWSSLYFRKQCVEAGFEITSLYPVFHQGWDCDEWGAMGTKDGKTYRLETDHGNLKPKFEPTLLQRFFGVFK